MYHMKQASIRDLRYGFARIEDLLRQGYEVQITRRRKVIGRLVPERPAESSPKMPDFLAQLRQIYGDRILPTTGAEIVAEGRNRDDLIPTGKKGSGWQKRPKTGSTPKAAS